MGGGFVTNGWAGGFIFVVLVGVLKDVLFGRLEDVMSLNVVTTVRVVFFLFAIASVRSDVLTAGPYLGGGG